jgi:hypothetical protein
MNILEHVKVADDESAEMTPEQLRIQIASLHRNLVAAQKRIAGLTGYAHELIGLLSKHSISVPAPDFETYPHQQHVDLNQLRPMEKPST